MILARAAVLAALFFCGMSFPTFAQDVTFTSQDGAVTISGELLGFDGEFYRVETVYGELTVDGSGVNCEGPGCPNLTDFVAELDISGAATMGRFLMPALLEAFASRNGLKIEKQDPVGPVSVFTFIEGKSGKTVGKFRIHNSNTDEGFADLLADEADMVMAHREVQKREVKLARDAGLGNLMAKGRSRVLSLDALVAIVAPSNPVRRITTSDLAQVFAGNINNWKKLGGPDAPIVVHLRDEKSGLGQAVHNRLLEPLKLKLSDSAARHSSDVDLARAVASDPFALGVASHSEVGNAAVLVLSGACGFEMRATRRTIKTEDYPLTAPMFLYLPARRVPKLAREFLAYTRSPSAQLVIRRAGFVDQAPEQIRINAQGDRFANAISFAGPETSLAELQKMVGVLSGLRRLSTTFRFKVGSVRLDAQSSSNVEQLASAIEAGRYDTKRLVFVGFSDGLGAASGNQKISLRRANAVRTAVIAAAETASFSRLTLDVEAFGEALPMACDDSEWGRQVNRRVEVWVR